MKIGVFADSEESFVQGAKKKSTEFKLCFLEVILKILIIPNLIKSGFGPKALERLGQIIRSNVEVAQFVMRKSALSGASMRSFARSLGQMPSLIHLELANNSIEPQGNFEFILS